MGHKKLTRKLFRDAVFTRDAHKCRVCGAAGVDAHHITDRHEMPGGGYVAENGITLCASCHIDAEVFHETGGKTWSGGFHPDDLYELIGSSHQKALAASIAQDLDTR